MFILDCLAFTDITTELYRQKNTFVMVLKTKQHTAVSLTLSYTQAKVLADAMLAAVQQAPILEMTEPVSSCIMGDMTMELEPDPAKQDRNQNEKGESEPCRPNILPVPTETASLSRSA